MWEKCCLDPSMDHDAMLNGTVFRVEFAYLMRQLRTEPSNSSRLVVILFLLVYVFVGCIGNILTCYIIGTFKNKLSTINMYFVSLAVSDCMMLVSFTLAVLNLMQLESNMELNNSIEMIGYVVFHMTSSTASNLMIIIITIDRYIAVCHPFTSRKLFTRPRTARIIIFLWMLAFLNAVVFASRFAVCDKSLMNTWCVVHCSLVSMDVISALHFVLPTILIVTLYSLIAFRVWRSSSLRASTRVTRSTRAFRRQMHISMVFVFEFIFCWGPLNVGMYLFKYTKLGQDQTIRTTIFIAGLILYLLSAVINPVIYFILLSKFRKGVKMLLCFSEDRRGKSVILRNVA